MTENTTEDSPLPDPRPLYAQALDQLQLLAGRLTSADLDRPTPCDAWTVRQLVGHLTAGMERVAVTAAGGDPTAVPAVIQGIDDEGWADALASARAHAERAWADHDLLERLLTVPWGRVPGKIAVAGYAQEAVMHSWDLAVATDHLDLLDPDLGGAALMIAQRAVPAEARGGPVPFGPVVAVAADADVYVRLAAWLGRRP